MNGLGVNLVRLAMTARRYHHAHGFSQHAIVRLAACTMLDKAQIQIQKGLVSAGIFPMYDLSVFDARVRRMLLDRVD